MRAATLGAVVLLAAGCRVPDSRTAVELEREAARRRLDAEAARASVAIHERTRPAPSAVERDRDPSAELAGLAAGRVAHEQRTAVELEAKARAIRGVAEEACKPLRPAARSSCPLGDRVAKVEPIRLGVRLHFHAPPSAEQLRVEVACAVAQAHVERSPVAERCPLLAPGASARVVDRPQGALLEVVGNTESEAAEIRRRASERR